MESEKPEKSKRNEKIKESQLIERHDNKTFLYLGCCHINIGLVFTYLYILSASGLNIINRIIFRNYKFTFNFTYSFLQQLISLFLFIIIGSRNEYFKKNVGELNLSEFSKFKCYYISFALIFISNTLMGFYGMQLVNNVSMFLSLRKLTTGMLFILDLFYDKKKISFITMLCIFLMSGGSIVIGLETFTNDYMGYLIVFINNIISITYSKLTEVFRKHTGVSNLKLLVFNTYLAIPLLIIGGLICGEYKKVYNYYIGESHTIIHGTFYGLVFYLCVSCIFCAILSSSFFLSNEKTSSLMTNLIVNTKTVFISIFLHFFDKKRNKLSPLIITGLIMTTCGAIFINAESLCNNLVFDMKKKKKEKEKKHEEEELIDVKDDTQENKESRKNKE